MANPEMLTQSIVSGVCRAECLVSSLVACGADVLSVSIRGGLLVIRINRNAFTDALISNGKVSYVWLGCGTRGKYKQGVYMQDGCKVVWSESIH